jgi:hypothetical protein
LGRRCRRFLKHLQQFSNFTPHLHKIIILREMSHFLFSSSLSIALPIFGGHKKNTSCLLK